MKKLSFLLGILVASVALGQPALTVTPQTGSSVNIGSVTLDEDGFLVVHAFDTQGELVLTPPLSVVYLNAGAHENVSVALDTDLLEANGYGATAKDVLPMLHVDANANQMYEFPEGGDVPVMVADAMVTAKLSLTYQPLAGLTPSILVSAQSGPAAVIDSVTLAQDGFVVVHAFDMSGELVLTPPLGVTYLSAGYHENVSVELDAELLAANGYGAGAKNVLPMLHVDANANQVYEFPDGGDVPVTVNDEMVVAPLLLMTP